MYWAVYRKKFIYPIVLEIYNIKTIIYKQAFTNKDKSDIIQKTKMSGDD